MTRIRELPRLVVMASGRGSNLEAILDAIDRGELRARVVAVISDRPDAQALERAARRQIEALALDYRAFPDRDAYHEALLEHLVRIAPDLIVLAGYMRLLPGRIVARFPQRIVNIHPSLLPAFPGLNPHRQALDYGVKVSGCTVHFVDEGMDTGPIIMQAAVPVLEDDTEKEPRRAHSTPGARALPPVQSRRCWTAGSGLKAGGCGSLRPGRQGITNRTSKKKVTVDASQASLDQRVGQGGCA